MNFCADEIAVISPGDVSAEGASYFWPGSDDLILMFDDSDYNGYLLIYGATRVIVDIPSSAVTHVLLLIDSFIAFGEYSFRYKNDKIGENWLGKNWLVGWFDKF